MASPWWQWRCILLLRQITLDGVGRSVVAFLANETGSNFFVFFSIFFQYFVDILLIFCLLSHREIMEPAKLKWRCMTMAAYFHVIHMSNCTNLHCALGVYLFRTRADVYHCCSSASQDSHGRLSLLYQCLSGPNRWASSELVCALGVSTGLAWPSFFQCLSGPKFNANPWGFGPLPLRAS